MRQAREREGPWLRLTDEGADFRKFPEAQELQRRHLIRWQFPC